MGPTRVSDVDQGIVIVKDSDTLGIMCHTVALALPLVVPYVEEFRILTGRNSIQAFLEGGTSLYRDRC